MILMNRRILLAVPLALFLLPACVHAAGGAGAGEGFRLIGSAELSSRLKDKDHPVHLFDANGDGFRRKHGTIAGATLLTSYSSYDVAKTLPEDKSAPLVFYCANPH